MTISLLDSKIVRLKNIYQIFMKSFYKLAFILSFFMKYSPKSFTTVPS